MGAVRVGVADFETTIGERTNVWLWGIIWLDTMKFEWGTSIESFIEYVHEVNSIIYFHNLKFDGMFLLDFYLKSGLTVSLENTKENNTIVPIISDSGKFYKITAQYKTKVEYRDSLKLIPLPVEVISKAYGLDAFKLQMDYKAHKYGEENEPTDDDIDYLHNDCYIVAKAISILLNEGMSKLTVGSNALAWYKENQQLYDKLFPQLTPEQDTDIRKAYKGAWCYCNPVYQGKKVGVGRVYDVNSMYPWAMRCNPMPIGKPIYFEGEYTEDEAFPLWVATLRITCKVKPGKYPCIQLKNNPFFVATEFLQEIADPSILHITSVDWDLINECYDINSVEWICGYKFMKRDDVFNLYVDHWYEQKAVHTQEHNKGLRELDKLMLNNLYGKFGSNPIKDLKEPYLENEMVKFKHVERPKKYDGYVPIAAFITAYCRQKIVHDANTLGDRFLYADTDSLHCLGDYDTDLEIHETKLGAYKHESTFTEAMYYRPKMYIETIDGKLDKKAGGLPKAARGKLDYSTLRRGSEFDGKLRPVTKPGGVVLEETTYIIR